MFNTHQMVFTIKSIKDVGSKIIKTITKPTFMKARFKAFDTTPIPDLKNNNHLKMPDNNDIKQYIHARSNI